MFVNDPTDESLLVYDIPTYKNFVCPTCIPIAIGTLCDFVVTKDLTTNLPADTQGNQGTCISRF